MAYQFRLQTRARLRRTQINKARWFSLRSFVRKSRRSRW
jgi:hypothetical protein